MRNSLNKQVFIVFAFSIIFIFPSFSVAENNSDKKGKDIYTPWQRGEFEIHQISTNCGESAFLIFPDGTTMIIDAGDMRTSRYFPPVPDNDIDTGEKIVEYILSMNPRKDKIDFVVLSHFHPDHTGNIAEGKKREKNEQGNFYETGISRIARFLNIGKIIDRSFSDYNYPQPYDKNDSSFVNYRRFIEWQKEYKNTRIEGFNIGSTTQIKPLYEADYNKYFLVRNVACNGKVWNWRKNEIKDYVNANSENLLKKISENVLSTAMLFTYGRFSYLTGGDLCGSLLDEKGRLTNVEAHFGEAAGEVDVCKTNHHGYFNAMVPEFVKEVNANVYVMPVHDSAHLGEKVIPCLIKRAELMPDKKSLIVPTYVPENFRDTYSATDFISHFPPVSGHVVIKVSPGGDSYSVYILDTKYRIYGTKWKSETFKSKGIK
ncbi:MBL fold metallo-hydrolase [Coprobacter secundus]|uniref:Metallo-beta-lactamase domain-containing protein n=1 Tax=Coprobacter secundus subsp. similis TaxID=2751153 RepID=A0A7G1HZR7_9BACT|nr:MBL fold metallo-hydrolase [Coprobacter secundus]BCI63934.1 hypothetical protein Cop2CBH44_22870 [Coprobacter secundus subsp. similis]